MGVRTQVVRRCMRAESTPCYVRDSIVDVQACSHAGVVSIGGNWGVRNFEQFSTSAPDVLLRKPRPLLRFGKPDCRGYLSQVRCTGKTPKKLRGTVLPCGFSFGAPRWAVSSRPRIRVTLATSLRVLKNTDGPAAEVLGQALADFIQQSKWTPDFIVPVPSKPHQAGPRFQPVLESADHLA